tara:strand:+ start:25350 stop:25721 length:372 start_codon:yes stop_codon:yes gene_type:complete
MSKNTMVELVTELEKLSPSFLKDKLIEKAKDGSFHDYRSKSACGKMYFIKCAQWFNSEISKVSHEPAKDLELMIKMDSDIKNGDYDEVYTEEDSRIVIAEAKADPNMSEKDKDFFIKGMAWKK